MSRLNLTLDSDTSKRLNRYAGQHGTARATVARQLLREALDARESRERRRKLAEDYARGRVDAANLLANLEAPQLELTVDDRDA